MCLFCESFFLFTFFLSIVLGWGGGSGVSDINFHGVQHNSLEARDLSLAHLKNPFCKSYKIHFTFPINASKHPKSLPKGTTFYIPVFVPHIEVICIPRNLCLFFLCVCMRVVI